MSNLTTRFKKVEAPELVSCIQRHLERLEFFRFFHQAVAAGRLRGAKKNKVPTPQPILVFIRFILLTLLDKDLAVLIRRLVLW